LTPASSVQLAWAGEVSRRAVHAEQPRLGSDLLKIGACVVVLLCFHEVAQVVNERKRPGVLGVDLVLGRELDAATRGA
jgi:hypothetical protein